MPHSISINSNDEYVNSQNVNLTISASDPSGVDEMKLSNTNDFSGTIAEAYNTVKSWVLSAGDGLKTVYGWFRDTVGNWTAESTPETDTITLDATSPTISNITSSNITTNSAEINFTTDELTISYIEYGLTTSYGSETNPNETQITNYQLQITSY